HDVRSTRGVRRDLVPGAVLARPRGHEPGLGHRLVCRVARAHRVRFLVPEENEDTPMKGVRQIVATVIAVAIAAGGTTVFAWRVCCGAEETSLISGTKLGVLVMLGVLFAVQGAFVAFFLYLRKHAKDNADVELESEWVELQRSRT